MTEVRGYMSADRFLADIRKTHGYGYVTDIRLLISTDTDTDTDVQPRIQHGYVTDYKLKLMNLTNFIIVKCQLT